MSRNPSQKPYWHPSRRKPLIFQNRPPRTWGKRKNPPNIRDLETFKEAHRRTDDRIKDYLEVGRRGWQSLPLSICRELETGRFGRIAPIDLLHANNAEARINFAEITVRHVQAHEALSGPKPVFFVTLTPEQFAVPERAAASFDIRTIQAWTRQVLAGFHFIGMVEVALFPFGENDTSPREWWRVRSPVVSWHVHLLLWDASYSRLNRALRMIRRWHSSFVVGTPSATCRKLKTAKQVAHRAIYMLKAPQKQYRICRYNRKPIVDPSTGEIVAKPYINKDWLRTGQRVRMCRTMADRYLDRLLFGQGEGTELCRAIRDEALRPFHAFERRAYGQRARGGQPQSRLTLG
jgi:hypothetical protein